MSAFSKYVSPDERVRRKAAQQAGRKARRAQDRPFVPEPFSQGPHARAVHAAGGKLIELPVNRHKFNARVAAHAPGCSAPVYPYGPEGGEVPCGATLAGERVFCGYCQPVQEAAGQVVVLLLNDAGEP